MLRFFLPVLHMMQLFKFPFVIVPHELEGSLGYVTAAAAVSSSSSQIVSLDVGGGSFQVDALSAPPRTCRGIAQIHNSFFQRTNVIIDAHWIVLRFALQ